MVFVDNRATIAQFLAKIDECTPGGFAIGLHIGFSGPTFLFQTFPVEWVDYYSDHGLQLRDPAVHWGFTNTGVIHWRDLVEADTADVIGKAKGFGLTHGMTLSLFENGTRTVAGFARPDRDYLDVEAAEIMALLKSLHRATQGLSVLSKRDMDALTQMSIRLSHT